MNWYRKIADITEKEDLLNHQGKFDINDIKFDQKEGLGATSWNQNINYMGMIIWMTPLEFLDLNTIRDHDHSLVKNKMQEEAIASPFLKVKIDSDKLQVYGHEGRGRMKSLVDIGKGNIQIPVHVIFNGKTEIRTRHIKPENFLGKIIEPDEEREYYHPGKTGKPFLIKRINVNGKEYNL